eukprot:gene19571-21502_t
MTRAGASSTNVTELYKENIRLREGHDGRDVEGNPPSRGTPCIEKLRRTLKQICPIVVVLVVFVTCITMLVMYYVGASKAWPINKQPAQIKLKQSGMTGQRIDKDLQDCAEGGKLKKTFPDVDYAFYGYNILRGYPMAVGHDPGLTHPIFAYDYSEKRQTADCRFSIPKGLILAPDVSCVTSFTSQVIRETRQISQALSVSAQVSGGGWGVSFSASAEYKKQSSAMSSLDSIFIYSQAKCDYYFAMLDEIRPPALTPSFIQFARAIKGENDVYKLFDYFGTHFMTHVTFGAKFVYQHKMSKTQLKTASSSSLSISAQASYSGLFSLSGGFSMSKSQQQAAESFQSKVETSTISIGAPPPANGDTMTWASTVKDSPVPTRYKLSPIDDLFTPKYMADTGVDLKAISTLIKKTKTKYCNELMKKGIVDSCKQIETYKEFKEICLGSTYYKSMSNQNHESCVNACLEESTCIASDYHSDSRKCYLFDSKKAHTATKTAKAITTLFIDNMKLLDVNITIKNIAFKDSVVDIGGGGSGQVENATECAYKCLRALPSCRAFSVVEGAPKNICKLYTENVIADGVLKFKAGATLKIVTKFKQ